MNCPTAKNPRALNFNICTSQGYNPRSTIKVMKENKSIFSRYQEYNIYMSNMYQYCSICICVFNSNMYMCFLHTFFCAWLQINSLSLSIKFSQDSINLVCKKLRPYLLYSMYPMEHFRLVQHFS